MVWLDTNPHTRIKNGAKYINAALFYVYEITKHHGKKEGELKIGNKLISYNKR